MKSPRARPRWFSYLVAVVSIVALAIGTQTVESSLAQAARGHPSSIVGGTCDEPGAIAYELSNVGPGLVREGTPSTSRGAIGPTTDIYPVDTGVTTVRATLTRITDTSRAIAVYDTTGSNQQLIACGKIGGMRFGNTLAIGLEETNSSGFTGIAVLRQSSNRTVVTVYLSQGLAGEAAASPTTAGATPVAVQPTATTTGTAETTPTASPAEPTETNTPKATSTSVPGGTPASSANTVDIQNFAFSPDTLSVPAGTTVTWTNLDSTAHTVTADNGAFNSDDLPTGQTYSFTFNTPGTYAYHCSIHPYMTGTVTVT
jgi:plastocyanin